MGRTVLLGEEGQTTDREGPAVLPLTLHLSFLFSAVFLSTATGLRRSPWKRSRPCNHAHSCDSCLSVCLEAPPRKVAVSLHPARRSLRIRRCARGPDPRSHRAGQPYTEPGTDAGKSRHRHAGHQARPRLPRGMPKREEACGSSWQSCPI